MTVKYKSRKLGRMIRRLTGLHLQTSMRIGKYIVQKKPSLEYSFPDEVKRQSDYEEEYDLNQQTQGISTYIISGPKGQITCIKDGYDQSLNEQDIINQYENQ